MKHGSRGLRSRAGAVQQRRGPRPPSRAPPREVQLPKLISSLKSASSRLLRKEYDTHIRRHLQGGHIWSGSYSAASCGGPPLTVVKQYTENQKHTT
ncbi:transposase [Streptomyces sp. NPDC005648]|uniref:transposase n=1 Tax=Streptomyces sp. NPDC005648 TaxID=3157044 RepID=UPI0033ACA4E1